jgi:hypothetical protein
MAGSNCEGLMTLRCLLVHRIAQINHVPADFLVWRGWHVTATSSASFKAIWSCFLALSNSASVGASTAPPPKKGPQGLNSPRAQIPRSKTSDERLCSRVIAALVPLLLSCHRCSRATALMPLLLSCFCSSRAISARNLLMIQIC